MLEALIRGIVCSGKRKNKNKRQLIDVYSWVL